MLKKLAKISLAAAGLLAGAASANAASVGSAQLSLAGNGELVAIAEDGQNYSKLESSSLTFSGNLNVSMDSGRVKKYGIALGVCGGNLCSTSAFKMLDSGQTGGDAGTMNFDEDISFDVSADQFPQGLSSNLQAANIFSTCNDKMSGFAVKSDKSYTHYVSISLGLDLKSGIHGEFEVKSFPTDYTNQYTVPVTVRCKAPRAKDPVIGFDPSDLKVRGVKLFLTTYSHSNHSQSPGITCPILHVTARFETNQKGLVHFDLRKVIGAGPLQTTPITIESKHQPDGKFKAEYKNKWYFNKTTYSQFQVEEKVNPIHFSSPWKDITIQCTSAGGGGFSVDSGPQDSQPVPAKYDGELDLADSANTKRNACPRQGQAVFKINSNKSDPVSYRLDCTGGRSWQGSIQMFPNGLYKYQGVAAKQFDVTKTEKVACALKRVAGGKTQILALRGKQYTCVKTNIDPASDDLVSTPKPNPADVRLPGFGTFIPTSRPTQPSSQPASTNEPTRIPDPKVVSCINGRVVKGDCKCRRGDRVVRIGRQQYRCVKKPVVVTTKPVRPSRPASGSSVTGTRISCAGGIVRNQSCYCPRTHKRTQVGRNAYRCVNVVRVTPSTRLSVPNKRRTTVLPVRRNSTLRIRRR